MEHHFLGNNPQKNRMSLDFGIQEANESQEDSTMLGQSSRRLQLSRDTSGEAYRQDLKSRLINSKKLNNRNLDGSKSSETNNSKSPMMAQNRESHPSVYSKGSLNAKAGQGAADLVSKIVLPNSYDRVRNKKEF